MDLDEKIRYDRQLRIPEIGEGGQRRLRESKIVIIGIGGLGCASATYLTAAGVGWIKIVDFDVVNLSDLNRQILYAEQDIGERKVVVAKKRLSSLNPRVKIIPIVAKVDKENVSEIIRGADVVVDGLDNFESRLIVNSACVHFNIPYVYGGVSRLRGMLTTILPYKTPCLS